MLTPTQPDRGNDHFCLCGQAVAEDHAECLAMASAEDKEQIYREDEDFIGGL